MITIKLKGGQQLVTAISEYDFSLEPELMSSQHLCSCSPVSLPVLKTEEVQRTKEGQSKGDRMRHTGEVGGWQFLHCSDYVFSHKDIETDRGRRGTPGGRQEWTERKWTRKDRVRSRNRNWKLWKIAEGQTKTMTGSNRQGQKGISARQKRVRG